MRRVFQRALDAADTGGMSAEPLRPIYSSRLEDPAVAEPLETFVVGLAERVDGLQDTEASGDLAELAAHVRALGAEATDLGFAPLAVVAAAVEAACQAGASDQARMHLVDLTEISQRVRLGYRGAL